MEQEKASYIASLHEAYALADTFYSGEQNQSELLAAHDAWDTELNAIYDLLRDKLSAEEMELLRDEQREWIVYRDEYASELAEVGELTYWKIRLQMTMNQTMYLIERYYEEL